MPNTIEATITQKTGLVYVERMGERLSLEVGDSIYEQDLILTGPDTVAEIQYRDGTKSRLAPDTQMKLLDFEYGISADSENSFLVDMTHGAMRTVTGEIVKQNPNGFIISTDGAEMNIYGSEVVTSNQNNVINFLLLHSNKGAGVGLEGVNNLVPLKSLQMLELQNNEYVVRTLSPLQAKQVVQNISPYFTNNIPLNDAEEGLWQKLLNIDLTYDDTQGFWGGSRLGCSSFIKQIFFQNHNAQQGSDMPNDTISTNQPVGKEIFPLITNPFIDNLFSNIFGDDELNGQSVTQVPTFFYDVFTIDDSPLKLTDVNELVIVNTMQSGEILLEGGDDTINIGKMSYVEPVGLPTGVSYTPTIDVGAGNNTVFVENFESGVIGGIGSSHITIGTMGIEASLFFSDTDSAQNISVTNMAGTIHTGAGNDTVTITNDLALSSDQGTSRIDLGDGNNSLYIDSILGTNTSGGSSIFAGSGNDTVTIKNYGEIFEIDLGEGNDILAILDTKGQDLSPGSGATQNPVDLGLGTDIFITASDVAVDDRPLGLEVLIKVTGTNVDDLDIKKYNVVVNNNGSITLGQGWTGSGTDYTHSSGATLTVVDTSFAGQILVDNSVTTRSIQTMSIADTSSLASSLPVADSSQSSPTDEAYSSTVGHYNQVI